MKTINEMFGNRKTIIQEIEMTHQKPSEPTYPSWVGQTLKEKVHDIWTVRVVTKTGLRPVKSNIIHFVEQHRASKFLKEHPVGSEFIIDEMGDENERLLRARQILDDAEQMSIYPEGNTESDLVEIILADAGIITGLGGTTAPIVLDFLGPERVNEIKEKYKDFWRCAAEFEYCYTKIPHNSPSYLASKFNLHLYIAKDEFSAGYILRDLETIIMGVEGEALRALEMRQKAGAKGSESSARARKQRVASLMAALEIVAQRNPDIAATLGPKSLLAIALPEAANAEPKLWAQGQGQAEEYLGEIRRGEAGRALQSRYQGLFAPRTA